MSCVQLLLTIWLDWVLAGRDEVLEALELVAGHGAVELALESKALLEVGVKVLLEGEIPHEAHSADAAVKLDSLEDLSLRCFGEPRGGDVVSEARGAELTGRGRQCSGRREPGLAGGSACGRGGSANASGEK